MSQKVYKTIFFDWNRTLSDSLFWNQLADPRHKRHEWYSNIINFLFVENKRLINDWMNAKFNEEYVVGLISNKFGYPKKVILSDLEESCRSMKLVNNDVLELVYKIKKKGIECVIATDNMDTFMKYTKPAMKLENYFDDFLVSYDRKILKFEVKKNKIPFFDDYLSNKNLSYEDVLLIDDCDDKTGTYKKLGFDILKISSSEDFVNKLRILAE